MDFGLFHTWNVLYDGGTVPWDPAYRGGKLLEEEAYAKNWDEMQAVEAMGWDFTTGQFLISKCRYGMQ